MLISQNDKYNIETSKSLLDRLRNHDDSESWLEFFQTYGRPIYGFAMQSGLSEFEAQEVVQETVIAVSQHIGRFRYDPVKGSFKNWLFRMTRWRIVDQLRKRNLHNKRFGLSPKSSKTESRTATVYRIPDSSQDGMDELWEREWQENLMDRALQAIRVRLDPKIFQIFDLYALKNLQVAKVCELLEVSASQVYLAKSRVMAMLRHETRILESKINQGP